MKSKNIYSGHRCPKEIISHVVWLYYRFTLSFRDIEELMAYRGIDVTYESIRQWCDKFGKFTSKFRDLNEGNGSKGTETPTSWNPHMELSSSIASGASRKME